jgi:hypothetical protein
MEARGVRRVRALARACSARRAALAPLASRAPRAARRPLAAVLIGALAVALPATASGVARAQETPAPLPAKPPPEAPPGRWKKSEVPPGWLLLESPQHRYQLQSQLTEPPTRALAEQMDAVFDAYEQLLPPARALTDPLVIKVFVRREEYKAHGATPERERYSTGREAWYDPSSGDVVVMHSGWLLGSGANPEALRLEPDRAASMSEADLSRLIELATAVDRAWSADTAALAAREGWRQYLAAATSSEVEPPAWLEVGLADCFAAARTELSPLGRKVVTLGGLNEDRLRAAQRAAVDGSTSDLTTLLALWQEAFAEGRQADSRDAQAWSLVQFLFDQPEPELRGVPQQVLRHFRDFKSADAAVESALKDVDLAQLARRWQDWVAQQSVADPLADLAREFGARVQPGDLRTFPRWREVYNWHRLHPSKPKDEPAEPAPEIEPLSGEPDSP